MQRSTLKSLSALACAFGLAGLAQAAGPILIEKPWVRATAPGQQVAGGFLTLTAERDMKLTGGSSPVSEHLELHTMKMDKGVMEMRQVHEIALPKGKAVQLKPGGLHIMFIDLKKQIRAGDKVPVSLTAVDAAGKTHTLDFEAEAMAPGGGRMPR